jgi:hypothetical protein
MTRAHRCLLLFACCLLFGLNEAAAQNNVRARERALKELLERADTLRPFSNNVESIYDTISMMNDAIDSVLTAQLQDPALRNADRDRLLRLEGLGGARAADGRLWIFDWYENTGGSWKSNIVLLHFRDGSGRWHTYGSDPTRSDGTDSSSFCDQGASFGKIYKLHAPGRALYLCIGEGVSCNTCIYEIATVVELTTSGARFGYPAFRNGPESSTGPSSCLTIEARMGDIDPLGFDPKTGTLTLSYITDDNTPVKADPPRRITRKLKFDGKRFRGNPYQ